MKTLLIEYFEYLDAMNRATIEHLEKYEQSLPEKVLPLLSHMINAHYLWNCRILNEPFKHGAWAVHSLAELKALHAESMARTMQIIEDWDLKAKINYSALNGTPYSNILRDILLHIVNHASYHRGQIMSLLRGNGMEVIATDYIVYRRELTK